MFKKITLSALSVFTFIAISVACSNNSNSSIVKELPVKIDKTKFKKAVFASGCFWCVEAIYESVKGVEEVYSGYAGGHTVNPTYESSNTGKTGHAEAVEVWYDSTKITFTDLVNVYYASQNIEQVNGQGNDRGSQYRSIIFYQNTEEKAIIDTKINALTQQGYKVASEVKKLVKFWMGEEYHQNYERLHPNQPYIKSVSVPRLKKFQAKMPEILKKNSH